MFWHFTTLNENSLVMSVRKIPLRYSSISGVTPSQKYVRIHEFDSSLKKDLLTILEFDPNVQSFEDNLFVSIIRMKMGSLIHIPRMF